MPLGCWRAVRAWPRAAPGRGRRHAPDGATWREVPWTVVRTIGRKARERVSLSPGLSTDVPPPIRTASGRSGALTLTRSGCQLLVLRITRAAVFAPLTRTLPKATDEPTCSCPLAPLEVVACASLEGAESPPAFVAKTR